LKIKVLLADDHHLMMEGFRITLKEWDIDVIETAYKLDGLSDLFFQIKPDVLVIDLRFEFNKSLDGLDLCEEILAKDPAAKIVVFSQFDDEYIIEKTYKIGALAFIRKDENTDVLVEAIKQASQGKVFFSPAIAQRLALSVVTDKNPAKLLDEKELRVFKLIADGASLNDIAEDLDFSTKTGSTVIKSIKQKLNIDNSAEFTKLAIKFGITDLELKHRI
jgi:two-component system invasion response regulator UvrY